MNKRTVFATILAVGFLARAGVADTFDLGVFDMELVFVGDVGNPDDDRPVPATYPIPESFGLTPPMGAVDYEFSIGKYEMTCEQLGVFDVLNPRGNTIRTCDSGTTPAIIPRGVSVIGWVNALNEHNGYPPAYKIGDGDTLFAAETRVFKPGEPGYNPANPFRDRRARFFLPTFDEFHKSAFYNADEERYHQWATGDIEPTQAPAGGSKSQNELVFDVASDELAVVDMAGGESFYGTVGQSGNIPEWEEWQDTGIPTFRVGGYERRPRHLVARNSRQQNFGTLTAGPSGFRIVMVEPQADLAADFNFDNEVNFTDFLILAENFGEEQEQFAMFRDGDANLDKVIDFQDFLLLANNFGASNAEDVAAVPEPSSLVLCSGLVGLLMLRRRRH